MTPTELHNLLRKYLDKQPNTYVITKELDGLIAQIRLLNLSQNSKEFKICLMQLSYLFEEGEDINLQALKSVLSSLWKAIDT